MRRAVAVVALAGLIGALAGCSRDASASQVVAATARNLADIRSGTMDLEVVARGKAAARPVGFRLNGPFATDQGGRYPVARLTYEEFAGGRTTSSTFISTGADAYTERDGTVRPVPASALAALPTQSDGALASFHLDRWVVAADVGEADEIDGVAVDHLTGRLNVARAMSDLAALAAGLGADPSTFAVRTTDAEHLATLSEESTIQLWTGREDRLLRRLRLRIVLDAPDAQTMPDAVASLAPVTIEVSLDITDVGERVEVDQPEAR